MSESNRKPQALIIEDSEHLAFLLGYMLEREGFETATLRDGRQAAHYIAGSRPPDVVLMDLMLPYLDGFEILGLVRAHPHWKTVPVMVLSARSGEDDVVRVLESGANDFVRKPYRPRELLARVRRLISEVPDALI
ncbi:MAG: response regulator transcription factor [Steroidobacteraceae bacterium]|nr:response regulator transcription factor [Steroidobacteraceae bacterium]